MTNELFVYETLSPAVSVISSGSSHPSLSTWNLLMEQLLLVNVTNDSALLHSAKSYGKTYNSIPFVVRNFSCLERQY